MTRGKALVRRARPDEAEAINALIMRSKGHWGYARPFLDAYRPTLSLQPDQIAHDLVYCAEIDGQLAGVSSLKPASTSEIELHHLFVEPTYIGQGIGKALWHHAVALARSMGARALVFDSDPHARPFYERMGAVGTGDHAHRSSLDYRFLGCALICDGCQPK